MRIVSTHGLYTAFSHEARPGRFGGNWMSRKKKKRLAAPQKATDMGDETARDAAIQEDAARSGDSDALNAIPLADEADEPEETEPEETPPKPPSLHTMRKAAKEAAYARTDTGQESISIALLTMPVVGKIVQLSAASQFAHTMAMMLTSGMPILRCLETAGKSVGNYVMRRDILGSAVGVEEGKSLGMCLRMSKYLPNMLVEMTAMGEATGTLEMTLEAVARFYDNEVEIATAKATSLLEPAIIVVLAGIVVVIMFSVYLPLFSMY